MNSKFKTLLALCAVSTLSFVTAHAALNVNNVEGTKSIYFRTKHRCSDPNRYVEFRIYDQNYKQIYDITFKGPGYIQYPDLPSGQYDVIAYEMAGGSGVGMDCSNKSTGESLSHMDLTKHRAAHVTVTWDRTQTDPSRQASCEWYYTN